MADDLRAALRERLARRLHDRRRWSPLEGDYEMADFVLEVLADDWVPRAERDRVIADHNAAVFEGLHRFSDMVAERDAARAELVALLEGVEQVGWGRSGGQWGPLTITTNDDGQAFPVYRLSPSAASLHAGLTGAVTEPTAPAATNRHARRTRDE